MISTTLFSSSILCLAATLVQEADEPPTLEYGRSRSSTGWVSTPRGARVAIDHGIEWQGMKVYLSLTWTLVGVDRKTEECRWAHDVSAFWNKIGFAEVETTPGHQEWCVELAPFSGRTLGADEREYRRLSDGEKVIPVGSKAAEPGEAVDFQEFGASECKIDQPVRFFVSDPLHWKQVRRALPLERQPKGGDSIDFEHHRVLVLCLGKVTNCRGVSAASVRNIDGTLRIRLHYSTFQTDGGGVQHHPWAGIVLPRTEGPIVVERSAQGLIGGPPLWTELVRWEKAPPVESELAPWPLKHPPGQDGKKRRRRDF